MMNEQIRGTSWPKSTKIWEQFRFRCVIRRTGDALPELLQLFMYNVTFR